MAKHFVLEIEEDAFGWKRNEPKIAEEALLDGMYVVRTSVDQSAMSASEAVECYKDLGAVEQAFRCLKTVDLKVRPIHHRLEGRVRVSWLSDASAAMPARGSAAATAIAKVNLVFIKYRESFGPAWPHWTTPGLTKFARSLASPAF